MRSLARHGIRGLLVATFVVLISAAHPNWGLSPAGWPGFAFNAQHWAAAPVTAQPLNRIKWSAPVDLTPGWGAHYGTPLVSPANTVVFPVKTGATDGFRVEGRRASDGATIWIQNTGYSVPGTGWIPPCGVTLTPSSGVAIPDSGGRLLLRDSADAASSATHELVFYGAANYAANPSAYDSAVKINTPITTDQWGTLYFGFIVTAATPINLQSGIARIDSSGQGTWVSAATAANDPSIAQVAQNCTPALGFTGKVIYVGVVNGGGGGYLLCLDAYSLTLFHRVRLIDPNTGGDAYVIDLSTASPTVGPDGQVFYGVFDAGLNNNDRGWMLHYNATLTQTLTPGAFGWDHTPSIVLASAVPSYHGSSTYLLLTKYNNYANIGNGDGHNKVAVLDPNDTEVDPVSGVTVMREVMTMLGPTPDPGNGPGAVREWCINSAAVDTLGHAGLVNSEDGRIYRWDFNTNTLSQAVTLTGGVGTPYTPTILGPDGTVYVINADNLFAVGQ